MKASADRIRSYIYISVCKHCLGQLCLQNDLGNVDEWFNNINRVLRKNLLYFPSKDNYKIVHSVYNPGFG